MDNYYPNDSTGSSSVLLYKADKKVDEDKLKRWLAEQLGETNIKLIKEEEEKINTLFYKTSK